tara:strand:- start:3412 stop:4146 length:735 start_codon:yes stop_codon:yes gene_type:complete
MAFYSQLLLARSDTTIQKPRSFSIIMDGSVSVDDAIALNVGGMTCESCETIVHEALISIEGVKSAIVSHEESSAIVYSDGITRDTLSIAIRDTGYSVDGLVTGFSWSDMSVWKQSAHNTKWCLIGCSIGDFGTIAAFQFIFTDSGWSTMNIMILAVINGLLTSIALETIILAKQMGFSEGLKVAIGMSFISMVAMESSMNVTDYLMTGGAMLTWWAVPIMLFVGFITPWPYNYWRLKKYGKACH